MRHVKPYQKFINESLDVKTSAGLAICLDGKLLLAHTTGRNFKTGYGIPKGGIEDGETDIQAAIRETLEEIGVKVTKDMIDPTPYHFGVDARKWGYKKIVHYFVVKIDSLDQIGLDKPVVPKKWLQLEEINDARFMTLEEADKVITKSQRPILDNLVRLDLIR